MYIQNNNRHGYGLYYKYNKIKTKQAELIDPSPSIEDGAMRDKCKIEAQKKSRNMDQMKEYYHHFDNCMNKKPISVITEPLIKNNIPEKCVTRTEMERRYFYDHVWKYFGYYTVPVEKKICSSGD